MVPHIGLSEIGQIAVTIKDLPRAVPFYQQTLGMPHLFTVGSMAFFDYANVRFMLTLPEKPGPYRGNSILYYKVTSAKRTAATLVERGVVFESPPHIVAKMQHHDLWMAFFRDSEDNLMALMSEESRS